MHAKFAGRGRGESEEARVAARQYVRSVDTVKPAPPRPRAPEALTPPRSERRLSRRQALQHLAGLAAAVTPVAGWLGAAEARTPGRPRTGHVVWPSDPEYDTARF